jgi:hypothetical protein
MKRLIAITLCSLLLGFASIEGYAQDWKSDSSWRKSRKNVIRYNLSNALLFGFDQAIVFGYERVLTPKSSISVNLGKAGLPRSLAIVTDSFALGKDLKTSGFNFSVDYRFYLAKENKYMAPRGVYIGPFYSLNDWKRENSWDYTGSGSAQKLVTTNTDIRLHTLGFELGYQFVFWDRLALDMVLIGPGVGWYSVRATAQGNLTEGEREQLYDALKDIITQKFPGMDFVLSDKQFDANGRISTTSIGFRYLIHVGFRF